MNTNKIKKKLFYGTQAVDNYIPINFLKENLSLFRLNDPVVEKNYLYLCILDARGAVKSPFKFTEEFLILLNKHHINCVAYKKDDVYEIVIKRNNFN